MQVVRLWGAGGECTERHCVGPGEPSDELTQLLRGSGTRCLASLAVLVLGGCPNHRQQQPTSPSSRAANRTLSQDS